MPTITLRVRKLVPKFGNRSYSQQGPRLWFPLWIPEEFILLNPLLPCCLDCFIIPTCTSLPYAKVGTKCFPEAPQVVLAQCGCAQRKIFQLPTWFVPQCFSTTVGSFTQDPLPVIPLPPPFSDSQCFHTHLWQEKPFQDWKRRKMLKPIKGMPPVMCLFISRCFIWKQSSMCEHEIYIN